MCGGGPRARAALVAALSVEAQRELLAAQVRDQVRTAVEHGATWQEVGRAFGVSGSTAWRRWGA